MSILVNSLGKASLASQTLSVPQHRSILKAISAGEWKVLACETREKPVKGHISITIKKSYGKCILVLYKSHATMFVCGRASSEVRGVSLAIVCGKYSFVDFGIVTHAAHS